MRILVVDDHEVVRRGVASLLGSQPYFTICGEAFDGMFIGILEVNGDDSHGTSRRRRWGGSGGPRQRHPSEKLDGSNNIRSGVGIAGSQERVRHFRGTVQIKSSDTRDEGLSSSAQSGDGCS
jgi:hypothetical protein